MTLLLKISHESKVKNCVLKERRVGEKIRIKTKQNQSP